MTYNLDMLKRVKINNLAIIENVDISFKEGFTVLMGASGAGKSLMIDSLSLLLGERASNELIRQGEEKATITGMFDVHNSRLEAILNQLDISYVDNELTIERVISRKASSIKANGVNLSLNDLKRISKQLADIHTQFDYVKILSPENYLDIIDGFSYEATSRYKTEYAELLSCYRKDKKEYLELLEKKKKIEESKDLYSFQLKELKESELKENEENEIKEELSLLKNYDKIYSLSHEAEELIRGDMLDHLYELNQSLSRLGELQESYKSYQQVVDESYYRLEDLFRDLKKNFQSLDYDPERLNYLEQREMDLAALKRKYRKDIAELIAYRDELQSYVGDDSKLEEEIKTKEKAMKTSLEALYKKGSELSLIRKRIAKTIEKEIIQGLKELLLDSKFEVQFNPIDNKDDENLYKENGLDSVDFLIETNIGEGLKPLSKVVSGGEASRIMLAFKALFIKANKIETVIFDEIDTGISGEAAERVARKIKEISMYSQVIAITHLPQVASKGSNHLFIDKKVKGGRTFTEIKELDLEGKVREIAHLISGDSITAKQLEYARELLLNNL